MASSLSKLSGERGPPPHFAGRTEELANMNRCLDAIRRNASEAQQGMLLFTGVPGIGKTHLAKHFTTQSQSKNVRALHIGAGGLATPDGLVTLIGRAIGAEDAVARAAGIDSKITGGRALSVGVNLDAHRPVLKCDYLLRATSHLSVWRKKVLILVVDEIQNMDAQSAEQVRTLHEGEHRCPIMFVGVGLLHSPSILSQHGISRMSHHQLEALHPDESVAAIYHGLHRIGVDINEDVAQALAEASMNFPAHVHSYIEAAATVFDERDDVNSDFAMSRILMMGKKSREKYYDGRLRAVAKISRLYPLVEHLTANNTTVIPLQAASSIIDNGAIEDAVKHGVLSVDYQDVLSFGIPSFQTYMQELAHRYRQRFGVDRDGHSSSPIIR